MTTVLPPSSGARDLSRLISLLLRQLPIVSPGQAPHKAQKYDVAELSARIRQEAVTAALQDIGPENSPFSAPDTHKLVAEVLSFQPGRDLIWDRPVIAAPASLAYYGNMVEAGAKGNHYEQAMLPVNHATAATGYNAIIIDHLSVGSAQTSETPDLARFTALQQIAAPAFASILPDNGNRALVIILSAIAIIVLVLAILLY